jgi:hypothetical protein
LILLKLARPLNQPFLGITRDPGLQAAEKEASRALTIVILDTSNSIYRAIDHLC